jgi:hypothetical protein
MAVNGAYMAWRVRGSAVTALQLYGEGVLQVLLPNFADLERRAGEIAQAEFARIGAQPVIDDNEIDMADAAELAEAEGQKFYERMAPLHQSMLNLFAAGLYHLVEQQLADLCHDASFTVAPPDDSNLVRAVADWYRSHFGLDLRTLPAWSMIDELRLVANVVKHAEGNSAEQLRQRRTELFEHPVMRGRDLGTSHAARPVEHPLMGEDLYVTEGDLAAYIENANRFVEEIVQHFEARGEEYYPQGG